MEISRFFGVSCLVLNLFLLSPLYSNIIHESLYTKPSGLQNLVKCHLKNVKKLQPISVMIHPKVDPQILDTIISEYTLMRPIYLIQENGFVSPCSDSKYCPKLHNLIGIFRSLDDINLLNWISLYNSTWNPRTRIVLWVTELTNEAHLKTIFQKFSSFDCQNVVILSMNDPENIIAHNYDPFILTDESTRGEVKITSPVDMLQPTVTKNMHGYPITISMYNSISSEPVETISQLETNCDLKILMFLSSWLNFSINVKSRAISLPEYYKLGSPSGKSFGISYDLITNYSDILGNTQSWGLADHSVEYLRPYARYFSIAMLPMPKLIPGIIQVFRSLDITIYILLVILSIISTIYMYAKGIDAPVLNTFRLIIQHHFYGIGSTVPDRIYGISWIIFTFLLVCFQQSRLYYEITNPVFYTGLETIAELANSDLPVMADEYQFLVMNSSSDPMKQKIASRTLIQGDYLSCRRRLDRGEDLACIIDTLLPVTSPYNRSSTPETVDDNPRYIYCMHDVVGEYWQTIFVRKGFPYVWNFDKGLERLMQAGIIAKWINEDIDGIEYVLGDEAIPLNLSHFDGPLKVFLIGIALSVGLFIYEIIWYRMTQK